MSYKANSRLAVGWGTLPPYSSRDCQSSFLEEKKKTLIVPSGTRPKRNQTPNTKRQDRVERLHTGVLQQGKHHPGSELIVVPYPTPGRSASVTVMTWVIELGHWAWSKIYVHLWVSSRRLRDLNWWWVAKVPDPEWDVLGVCGHHLWTLYLPIFASLDMEIGLHSTSSLSWPQVCLLVLPLIHQNHNYLPRWSQSQTGPCELNSMQFLFTQLLPDL